MRTSGPLLRWRWPALACALLGAAGPGHARPGPRALVSLADATLRLDAGPGAPPRAFPVTVGVQLDGQETSPVGTVRTGPDPRDPTYYVAARFDPLYHVGLPFLRLDRSAEASGGAGRGAGARVQPYSIHGPVTPTLIWGRASRGCVRMRPVDLRLLYAFALRHPAMPITFTRGPDPEARRLLRRAAGPAAAGAGPRGAPACDEAGLGVRPLRRQPGGRPVHARNCGGVDHR